MIAKSESPSLLIGSSDVAHGGLWVLDAAEPIQIDSAPTLGTALSEETLYRVVRIERQDARLALAIYDRVGLLHAFALDRSIMASPASIVVFAKSLYMSDGRSIIGLDLENMRATARWRLGSAEGHLHITAIGHRADELIIGVAAELSARSEEPLCGKIIEISTGRTLAARIGLPASFLYVDGTLVVADAQQRKLIAFDRDAHIIRERAIDGQPKTMAPAMDRICILVCDSDQGIAVGTRVVTLDRESWGIITEPSKLSPSADNITVVPHSIISAIKTGRRTNVSRVNQEDQLEMYEAIGLRPRRLWASSQAPLPPGKIDISARCPLTLERATRCFVNCNVRNLGDIIYTSAPPHPVEFSYRWTMEDGAPIPVADAFRTPLPGSLVPSGTLQCDVLVTAPDCVGIFRLIITLDQESVGRFDQCDDSNHCVCNVLVT